MGKGSTALGLIGLILAAGGLGLGTLAWISLSRVESQVSNLTEETNWYKYNGTTFNTDPTFTYLTFSGLTIEFELGQNESVYFSFTAWAHIEARAGEWSRILAYFRVDGIMESEPSAEVGYYNGDFTIQFMIFFQDLRYDLSPGIHSVTIVIYGDSTANYIWKSSLFVQRFPA